MPKGDNLFNENGKHIVQKFKEPEELRNKVEEYFRSCYKAEKDAEDQIFYTNIKPLTIQSLIYHLVGHKDTYYAYANGKFDEPDKCFSCIIAEARTRIEAWSAEALYTNRNQVGSIFNLKANYGWQDTQKVDMNHSGNIKISFNDDASEDKEDFQD